MTSSLVSPPGVAALLLHVAGRLESEFPTVPAATIVRCVDTAKASARTATSNPLQYAEKVETFARTDLVTLRLRHATTGDGA